MSVKKSVIPINNLFYMLCYAWNLLSIKDTIKVDRDEFKDAYSLLARIFSHGVAKLIKSGFYKTYIENQDELSAIKGKINIQQSLTPRNTINKKLVCEFDDYSVDNHFNQILHFTIILLLKNPEVDNKIKGALRKQRIYFRDVGQIAPEKNVIRQLRFDRNNTIYKMLISVAVLIYENTMVNEEDGSTMFKDFFREEQMQKVFEMFILNFYAVNLDSSVYHVHAPKIKWHIDEDADEKWGSVFDVVENPGDRRTDIVVENNEIHLQCIIDAKFYQTTFVSAYMNAGDCRLRTGHLNQVRGYILDSEYTGHKVGALIYPMVNDDLSKGQANSIQGANIIAKTINLADSWQNIEKDLIEFLHKLETPFLVI